MVHSFNFSVSNLSTSDFKLGKSVFLGKSDVPVAFFRPAFTACLEKSYSNFKFSPKDFFFGKYSLICTMSFLSIQLLNQLLYPFPLTHNLSPFSLD